MRNLIAIVLFAAACGGSQQKPTESAIVNEGSAAPDTCCCKSTPLTSEDGMPAYEVGNRMECSSKQGTCVDDVQCQQAEERGEPSDVDAPQP